MAQHQRRAAAKGNSTGGPLKAMLVGGLITAGLVAVVMVGASEASGSHPEPRTDATTVQAEQLVTAERYADYPRIAEVYAQAAEIPDVLDGLYCYCHCADHADHYSLLDCFKSDHGAGCDVCLTQAALAHRLHGEGKSLKEIRQAVDGLYGAT
jgi:hypothetical protein